MELRDDDVCFVCGQKNVKGLKLNFSLDKSKKTMQTIFIPEEWQQGYAKIIHGGIIATLLDEVMGKLAFELGINTVTAELSVRFRKPVGLTGKLLVKGQITEETSRIIYAKAEAKFEDGSLAAEANSKLYKIYLTSFGIGFKGSRVQGELLICVFWLFICVLKHRIESPRPRCRGERLFALINKFKEKNKC